MPNIPRATSGTITGMIADFNKAMEALGTSSPTEEQYQIASKLKHLEHKSQRHSLQNQNQKSTNRNQSLAQPMDSSGPQPIIVMTSGPNQSTIPLQLQLNPQAVTQALLPSPQVEQQLQQQQILIQQQQQFLQIQLEQQKLQKQMTEQLSLKQKDDLQQQKEEKKKKELKEQAVVQTSPPKPEVVKKDKQVSTSTPPSVTSTPTSTPNKQVAVSSSTTTKASDPNVSTSGVNSRKSLHRRLPHPTTEEMQTAVQTLAAAQNASRASAPAIPASQRPVSPLLPRKTQQSVISSQVRINCFILRKLIEISEAKRG